ncbi:MAG: SRPBCC family protein [Methylococcaceae bacterium]|nr:SRPBCC family protein [Methylococcaceae bacterium]
MIKTIAILLVILLSGVLVFAATRPDSFRIERSIAIKAPPDRIYAILSDFRQAQAWSPFEKKDPALKRGFSGARSGQGAVYEFDGNAETGSGRLTITDATAPTKLVIALDMAKPFQAHNIIEYTLAGEGDSTRVVWAMHGPSPYLSKLMCLFFDMEKMVGKDFETGLASLKALVEA